MIISGAVGEDAICGLSTTTVVCSRGVVLRSGEDSETLLCKGADMELARSSSRERHEPQKSSPSRSKLGITCLVPSS